MSGAAWAALLLAAGWLAYAAWMRARARTWREELWRARSEREELEARLARRGARMDALFDTINEAVIRLDARGNVVALNPMARRVFGLPRQVSLPQPMNVLYRDPDWNASLQRALERLPEPAGLPDMHPRARTLAARLAPLTGGEALLLCLDVSEQRRLEAERERLLRDLMHDLKTPLTSILGYARTIESLGGDEAVRKEAAGIIAREARRLNELLDAMLAVDRLNREPPENAQCEGEAVLRQAGETVRPAAETAGVRLELAADEGLELPMEEGDALRVLVNLLDNAIRHSPEGGVVRAGIARVRMGGQAWVELAVTDEGPGIDPRHLPRVTERFYRVEDARGRSGERGGHGMGLAIVAGCAERYGGELVLANRPEGGLAARIRFPLREEKAEGETGA